uniref:Mitochondrial fission factor n=1 Tax=Macrostomum lignano TaxID=282301 RepID=A0A1I8HEZ3_9PLAT
MSSNLYESHKFSEDVSRDMRIPERIGAQGALDSSSKGFGVDSDYPGSGFSRIVVDMSIPDRILATGEAGDASDPSYDPLDPSIQVRPGDLISVESPPDTITLDRVRYPDIQPEQSERPRRKRNPGGSDASDPGALVAASAAGAAPVGGNLNMALLRLQKRLEALESENEQRRRRELVLYPAIGLYFLFKIMGWLMRPRRSVGF